jgi:hypothetical protein
MIKYPGGEVAFWTILWIVAGGYVSYTYFQDGQTIVGSMIGVLPVASVLIWLDVRQAKWIIIAYFSMALVAGIWKSMTTELEFKIVRQMVLACFSIFALVRWHGGPNAD